MGIEEDVEQCLAERSAEWQASRSEVAALIDSNRKKFEELTVAARSGASLLQRRNVPMDYHRLVTVRPEKTSFFGRVRPAELERVDLGWYLPGIEKGSWDALALTKDGSLVALSTNDRGAKVTTDLVQHQRHLFDMECAADSREPGPPTVAFKYSLESFSNLKLHPAKDELLIDGLIEAIALRIEAASKEAEA